MLSPKLTSSLSPCLSIILYPLYSFWVVDFLSSQLSTTLSNAIQRNMKKKPQLSAGDYVSLLYATSRAGTSYDASCRRPHFRVSSSNHWNHLYFHGLFLTYSLCRLTCLPHSKTRAVVAVNTNHGIAGTLGWASLTGWTRGDDCPKSYKRHVIYSTGRTVFPLLSVKMMQYTLIFRVKLDNRLT